MPVIRTAISRSQLADLFGLEADQFLGIDRTSTGWSVISEGDPMSQASGTFPQIHSNTKYGGKDTAKHPKKSGGKK